MNRINAITEQVLALFDGRSYMHGQAFRSTVSGDTRALLLAILLVVDTLLDLRWFRRFRHSAQQSTSPVPDAHGERQTGSSTAAMSVVRIPESR